MKIEKLNITNIKKIKHLDLVVSGNVIKVSGDNASGKTSLLDSIMVAIAQKEWDDKMITVGNDEAEVVITTDRFEIKRTFTRGEKPTLLIREKFEGKVRDIDAKRFIESLNNKIWFDPISFCKQDIQDQIKQLKLVAGIDTSELEKKRKTLYDERLAVGQELKIYKGALQEIIGVDGSWAGKPILDSATEQDRLLKYKQLDSSWKQILPLLQASSLDTYISPDLTKTIEELTSMQETKVKDIEVNNNGVRLYERKVQAQAKVDSKTAQYEALTDQIDATDQEIKSCYINASYPIEGLVLIEGGALFNGVSLEELSSAEAIRLGCYINKAMNPELRVMLIRDASLLDEHSMLEIEKFASENDYQFWCEIVGKTEGSLIIEEGKIL